MGLTNKQKIHANKKAHEWYRFKVKLEQPFIRELKSYFAKQSKRVRRGLYPESVSPVLDVQYKRIVRNMTGLKLKEADSREFGLEEGITALLLDRANTQALYIDRTTRKLLERATEMAKQELIGEGLLFPTQNALDKVASNIFRSLNAHRPGSISVFETQALTEEIKEITRKVSEDMMEAAIVEQDMALAQRAADLNGGTTFQGIADDIGEVPNGELFYAMTLAEKTWVTMGDKRVRPWHNEANYQTVPVQSYFVVGGQLLMYPGDTSMGASMENVSGCRCSAVNM